MKARAPSTSPEFVLIWRKDSTDKQQVFRVWRNDWGGDMFEVLTADEFDQLKHLCSRFSIRLIEIDD